MSQPAVPEVRGPVYIQVYHRETGKAVEEPIPFSSGNFLSDAIGYVIGYIMQGNEMTEQEVRSTYRFEIVL